jgi:hypothetical protein
MEVFLGAFIIFPLIALGFLFSSVTLYFTLKFFAIPQNRFITAIKVTVLALLFSFLISLPLGLAGIFIPILPQLIGIFAPFIIYLYLLQRNYGLSFVSGLIICLIQAVLTGLIGLGIFMGVLLPMGLGAAILGG